METWLIVLIPALGVPLLGFLAVLLRRWNTPLGNDLAELFLQVQEILRSQNLSPDEKLRDVERVEARYAKVITKVESKGPTKAAMARRAEIKADKGLDEMREIKAELKAGRDPKPPQQE